MAKFSGMKERRQEVVSKDVIDKANQTIEEVLATLGEMGMLEALSQGGTIVFGESLVKVRQYQEGRNQGWEIQIGEEEDGWLRTDKRGKLAGLDTDKQRELAKKLGELDEF